MIVHGTPGSTDHRWTARELAAEVRVVINCAPHSARHSGLPQTCSMLDTPWNFWGATMAPLCSHTGLVGLVPKEDDNFLEKLLLWTKPGLTHMNQLEMPKHPSSPHPKKVLPTNVLWRYGIWYIWSFRIPVCEHQRSLAPIVKWFLIMMANDIQGWMGPKFSWHLSYSWKNTMEKTSTRKIGPTGDRMQVLWRWCSLWYMTLIG